MFARGGWRKCRGSATFGATYRFDPRVPVRHAPSSDVCRSISVNGLRREVCAATVAAALSELGYGCAKVATALNGAFLPAANRASAQLADGDQLEIVAARAGG